MSDRGGIPHPGSSGKDGQAESVAYSTDNMSSMLIGSLAFLFTVFGLIVWRLVKLQMDEGAAKRRRELLREALEAEAEEEQREANVVGGRRRGAARRRVNRDDEGDDFMRQMAREAGLAPDDDDEEDGPSTSYGTIGGEAIGKKKAAKLQAKAEKKAAREAELVEREERKKKEKEMEEKLEKERQKEKEEEEAEQEKLRKEKEERERREHEEYLKLKETFTLEEEGFDQMEEEETANLMRDFVDYIKKAKVVNMDELAAHFGLRSEDAIARLQHFLAEGLLTGIMDDRGKFIYITQEELDAVAKFLNQRGRVSISELADYSNRLIRLEGDDDGGTIA